MVVSGRLLSEITSPSGQTGRSRGGRPPDWFLTCGSAKFSLPLDTGRGYGSAGVPGRDRVSARRVVRPCGGAGAVAAGRDEAMQMLTGVRGRFRRHVMLAATDRFRWRRELAR